MARVFALAHLRLLDVYARIRDREEGQGLTEYVFLIVGVVAMVGAIIALLTTSLGTKLTNEINSL